MCIFSGKASLHGNKEEQIYLQKNNRSLYARVGNNNKKRKESNQNKRKIISISGLKLNIEIKWLFGT